MKRINIRTDLAVEAKERYEGTDTEVSGVMLEEKSVLGGSINITRVKILNHKGERAMKKPMGNYITIESDKLKYTDQEHGTEMAKVLSKIIDKLGENIKKKKVMVVGLGNRDATPDALGPRVISGININDNIFAVAPGVMAQTGMETGEIVEGIVKKIHPDALVVIDALAAKSSERLNRTIQISNTGIAPGSGVGNHRNEITEKTMGIPVIAIGVPTVISIPSLACDIMEAFCASQGEGMEDIFCSWPEKEKYHFLGEILDEKLWELFVTPKEIDEAVKRISYTLSEGINQFVAGRIF